MSNSPEKGLNNEELKVYLKEAEKKGHINRVRPHLDPVIKERVLMKISMLLANSEKDKIYH